MRLMANTGGIYAILSGESVENALKSQPLDIEKTKTQILQLDANINQIGNLKDKALNSVASMGWVGETLLEWFTQPPLSLIFAFLFGAESEEEFKNEITFELKARRSFTKLLNHGKRTI
jgi:hypothetical protein